MTKPLTRYQRIMIAATIAANLCSAPVVGWLAYEVRGQGVRLAGANSAIESVTAVLTAVYYQPAAAECEARALSLMAEQTPALSGWRLWCSADGTMHAGEEVPE